MSFRAIVTHSSDYIELSQLLKEGGHYFPQSEDGVPQPHFFNNDYIKNYGRYSYGVNCCQVAFLMLVKDLKRLGRSNVFRAEEGRNFERNV